jgi:hypothetical protein
MRRTSTLLLVLVLLGLAAAPAQAQGTASWTTGYPKAGSGSGTIVIKGTTTPDSGWTVGATGQVIVWPQNGGASTTQTFSVNCNGSWGEVTISGLTTGQTYNVVVQIPVTSCSQGGATVATSPATATPN